MVVRYLLLLCSFVLLTQVAKACPGKQKPAAVVKVSKRNNYLYSVGSSTVQVSTSQPQQEENTLGLKEPFKKYLGDNALPNCDTYIVDYQYQSEKNSFSNYLSDHTLHYFFLLFPQHYFW